MSEKVKIHKIKTRDFLRNLSSISSLTVSLPADDLEKFKREAACEGKSPEKMLSQLIGRYLRQCGRSSRL